MFKRTAVAAVLFLLLFPAFVSEADESRSIDRMERYTGASCDYELLPQITSFQMHQTKEWISADTMIAFGSGEYCTDAESSVNYSFFDFLDNDCAPWRGMLRFKDGPWFVGFPGEVMHISVIYVDMYGNMPVTGYPKLVYWGLDSSIYHELVLSPGSGSAAPEWVYGTELLLPLGNYGYKFVAKNAIYPEEFSTEISSFVVCERPGITFNRTEATVLPNGNAVLRWSVSSGDGVSYRVYFGPTPQSMSQVHEGSETRCELRELAYDSRYYWYVEARNRYGAMTRSDTFQFVTSKPVAKAYNYPNPFNPHHQSTQILFNMKDRGSAEIRIYTEMGDLCWSRNFGDLAPGNNAISFNGRDDNGNMLYNGTYICAIEKKYPNGDEKQRCRILVIK